MRYFLIGLLALLSLEASSTNSVNPAHIRGVVKDFKGGDVIMMINRKKEVVQVDDNGVFDYTTTLKEPGKAILFFEKYEYILPLYIENGMEASLTFSFVEKKDKSSLLPYDLELEYSGDNGDCTEFMQKYEALSLYNVWPFSRIDTMSFAQYREKFLEDMDRVKSELKEVKSLAFRRMMMAEIDRSIPVSLFRFAWSKLKNDADFEQFAESFDRNDPDNLGIAAKYLRHYLRHHPAPEREKDIHYLNSLKQVFSDQEVINAFADEYIQSYLKQAPDNMEEVYKLYSNISTNPEARALADDMYAHYVKLRKGAPAIDFEMTDAKGKKFRLSDFHGKAVYIDVWATWCGPCCAEIPHMEKLAAHYAKNKKIVLLSISLDKNKAKWEKKLAEDKPQWRQFICLDAFDSEVCKNYGINAIPRFLFFDKDGKVISLDAPRPSSAKITEYIDRHIR